MTPEEILEEDRAWSRRRMVEMCKPIIVGAVLISVAIALL